VVAQFHKARAVPKDVAQKVSHSNREMGVVLSPA
jgi:hypothetical protein